jgi:hypothetical protein
MQRTSPGPESSPDNGWSYSETIDEQNSVIRGRGRVDRLAVDLLRGTIEELHRRGHADIALTLDRPGIVDPCARSALTAIAERLARRHGRLTITWVDGTAASPADEPGETDRRRMPSPHLQKA